MRALYALIEAVSKSADYWAPFVGACVLSLLLVPLCRKLSIALGMVDKPGPRRINKTPIPRAGGLAVFLAVTITLSMFAWVNGGKVGTIPADIAFRISALSGALVVLGFLDDKFSLPPKVKLAGQLVVAFAAHFWAGVGFAGTFPSIPGWLDCAVTVFWIVGAVNAFNLIDGLDGLASGLSLIACVGITGSLFFVKRPGDTIFYFAIAGACLGFLRYNFNPASVFLGDTGSMYLGFVISVLPLLTNSSDSLFVSIGVPLLAMGVPIFDTSLAIFRRTLRAFLRHKENADCGNGKVMQADADHLHHRILRQVSSQKTAAFVLYAMAAALVGTGLFGLLLKNRAVALYIVVFVIGVAVIFKDMQRIELWDAGRLLSLAAHDRSLRNFRRMRVLAVPIMVIADTVILFVSWLATMGILGVDISWDEFHRGVPLFVGCTFAMFVLTGVYRVAWGRAMVVNYLRLFAACILGSLGGAVLAISAGVALPRLSAFTALFCSSSILLAMSIRFVRVAVRDIFYALGRVQLRDSSATRVIAYGAGLRYSAFRREIIRSTGHDTRLLVGLLDDDPLLIGRYIGGLRVYGALHTAAKAVAELKADEIVITCQVSPERAAEIAAYLKPIGVSVSIWTCAEQKL